MHSRPSLVPRRNLGLTDLFFVLFHLHILQISGTCSHFNSPLVPTVENIKVYDNSSPSVDEKVHFTRIEKVITILTSFINRSMLAWKWKNSI